MASGLSRRDDSDLLMQFSKTVHHNSDAGQATHSKQHESIFELRMLRIVNQQSSLIFKGVRRIFKGNFMLGSIGSSFARFPFEFDS